MGTVLSVGFHGGPFAAAAARRALGGLTATLEYLVELLARSWGVDRVGDTTRVWFELPDPARVKGLAGLASSRQTFNPPPAYVD